MIRLKLIKKIFVSILVLILPVCLVNAIAQNSAPFVLELHPDELTKQVYCGFWPDQISYDGIFIYMIKNDGNTQEVFVDYNGNVYENLTQYDFRMYDETISPCVSGTIKYQEHCLFHSGLCVSSYGNSYGYINEEYNWSIPPIYDEAYQFKEDYAIVRKGKLWSIINQNGESVFSIDKDSANISDVQNGVALVKYYENEKLSAYLINLETGQKNLLLNLPESIIYLNGVLLGVDMDYNDNYLKSIYIYSKSGEKIYQYDSANLIGHDEIKLLDTGIVSIYNSSNNKRIYISSDGNEIQFNSFAPDDLFNIIDTTDVVIDGGNSYLDDHEIWIGAYGNVDTFGVDANINFVDNWEVVLNRIEVRTKNKDLLNFNVKPIDKSKIKPYITPDPSGEICVYLNGNKLEFDALPYMKNDRTMVPMRAIFEALGANVDWDNDTQTAAAVRDGDKISITIGEDKLYKNGEAIELDASAELINDSRTFVPLRAISEAFGCEVNWNEEANSVEILDK